MTGAKRFLAWVAIVAVAAIDVAVYWNYHLYRRAATSGAVGEEKVVGLAKADRVYPLNETVAFELGRAEFDLAMDRVEDGEARDAALEAAIGHMGRSLRLNPASARAQFQYAQALLYRSYFAPGDRTRVYEEYKKAARLTGHDAPTYFEVGRILFSQWPSLGEADRRFAVGLLETVLERQERAKLATVFQIWDLSVRDYEVMGRILPEKAESWRLYAQFLGEKGLSLEERRRAMAKAEGLEFSKARDDFAAGERLFRAYRFDDAFKRYQACLNALKNIRFYQDLGPERTIDPGEHAALVKATYLNMAKCRLEAGKPFEEALPFLSGYLEMEDEVAALGELEAFLRERGIIEERLAAGAKDYRLFAFHLLLAFKMSKYRDVVQVGMDMERGVLVVPDTAKEDYARILELVGDSYQKLDYLYESNGLYERALAQGTDGLDVLLKLRKNKMRLNEEAAVRELDGRIARLLTPEEKAAAERRAEKGRPFVKALKFDGSDLTLEVAVRGETPGRDALLAVVWNDRVVWEDVVQGGVVRVDVASRLGMNSLTVLPVNTGVIISRLHWTFRK